MAKRKRDNAPAGEPAEKTASVAKKTKTKTPPKPAVAPAGPFKVGSDGVVTIQIIAGSYDRVLHGITATIRPSPSAAKPTKSKSPATAPATATASHTAEFADTFLFNAHTSAIRCLALSPPSAPLPGQTQKILLATGSTDERINIYQLAAYAPSTRSAEEQKLLSSLAPRPILENPKNRELGTLLHHSSNVTRLVFPNRSKLLSASEDSTIAVTRSRDWALLHSFKCPVPKVQGRPSGDTAPVGGAPAGVNDFAVHPSNKIMISVGKGERCMRLWNLETGKKSRVLNFERDALAEIGEGRHSTGEARRIIWGSSASGEDEFAVAFDRDVMIFGLDCKPRCRVMKGENTKVHELAYIKVEGDETVLAVSTEDGRILFFDTSMEALIKPEEEKEEEVVVITENGERKKKKKAPVLPCAKLVAQLGGKEAGVVGRIKDFTVLPVEDEATGERAWYIPSASSNGTLRVWRVEAEDLKAGGKGKLEGKLVGTYETQNRVTCLEAFVMIPRPDGAEDSEYEFEDESEDDEEESGEE
ncbi:WD40-repeat-containing domain protein [Podospora appendiculata]|uniref:WD40-repeat-containing domain protein n=1 Tax=Podospora appendiculata TaxID=314037 RepID=A0AAE0XET4_9PEZI|nr:WD40-repeat-containing domain protein [Podospora appendiculata]